MVATDISGIRFSACQERDAPEMGRLLAETFTRHDGIPVFASIAGQGGPKAMIRHISSGWKSHGPRGRPGGSR